MVFNSIQFLFFFAIVAAAFFFVSHYIKKNWVSQVLLLVASLYFYMCAKPVYVVFLLISILITWTSGLLMEGRSVARKRLVLVLSLVSNLGILFFFKYYNFFAKTLSSLSSLAQMPVDMPTLNILLPIGISFYTFQVLGYAIDVYKGKINAEHNFLTYALFVSFFPQILSGPIGRAGPLIPQFKVNHEFEYQRVTDGLKIAAWGMFKKVVIADRLAQYVSNTYDNAYSTSGLSLLIAMLFYSFQILCDFSGYSDMAQGTAKVLGFNIIANFRRPYFAKSVADFWHRWHISLSTWFRDYIYFPLGGSRVKRHRLYFNIMVTFIISGLWHGSAWNFIIWGFLLGVFQVCGNATRGICGNVRKTIGIRDDSRLLAYWRICFTFTLISITWVFFRNSSIKRAVFILKHVCTVPLECITLVRQQFFGVKTGQASILSGIIPQDFGTVNFVLSLLVIFLVVLVDALQRTKPGVNRIREMPVVLRWSIYFILIMGILLFGMFGKSEFIYFKF